MDLSRTRVRSTGANLRGPRTGVISVRGVSRFHMASPATAAEEPLDFITGMNNDPDLSGSNQVTGEAVSVGSMREQRRAR